MLLNRSFTSPFQIGRGPKNERSFIKKYIKGGGHSCNTLSQIRERFGDPNTSSSYRLNSEYDCGGLTYDKC